ncbi:MAG TPA: PA14 domain-containing protein, partial [Methylomirabilota bacterium]|nr:PA14 domain-containing protein [Methylomirabilota bacterium]
MKTKSLAIIATACLFASFERATAGAILRLYYDGGPGSSVAELRSSPIFPDSPTFYEVLTESFEGVENEPDNYGSWIRGYLEAPQTGDYVFWIASDDDSELWLSTDHTVGNLRKIAENIGAVGNRAFDVKPMQRSATITLERGKKYYVEVLHKEASGSAHVAVGWQLPDGTIERPLPGEHLLIFPVNESWRPRQTAPVILTDYLGLPVPFLGDTFAEEGETVVFQVTVEATQPATFQWLRNGVAIPDAILSFLRLEGVSQADNGARFSVRISNAQGTVTSDSAVLTVQPDLDAPTLVSAITRGNPNGLDVRFSEPVSEATAGNTANYQIAPGVTVTGATLIDRQTVRLATTTIAEGSAYTLTVNNVKDRAAAGNTITPGSRLTFLQVQGVITAREFLDIPGPLLTDLTGHARFPNNPNAVIFPAQLATIPLRRDNYGLQFQGFLIPPVSGDYIFYVSSRNQSALFLSPDASPANMVEIARESTFSAPRDWETFRDDGAHVSAPQRLEAGKKYYLEARFKAAARTGANFLDHFAVTWQMPDAPPPANGDPPIPGEYLSSLAALGPVTITTAPANRTVTELDTVAFTVAVDGTPPYAYEWLQNGEQVPGGTGPTLTLPSASLAANGASFTVRVSNAFSETVSAPAVLTVNQDTAPPVIEQVVARNIPTLVNVVFSERIDQAGAEATSNYAIAPGITISRAELLDDGRTVSLTTSPLSGGVQYTLTVNNLKDRAAQPNIIAANTSATFSFFGTARATRGLQALYNFREGIGTTIHDVSGAGAPLDLIIEEPGKVSWLPGGGLSVDQETRIISTGPATKINEAAKAANQLTVEVWVKPKNVEQQGPSRIVTISSGPLGGDRNFSLNMGQAGQPADQRARWTARGSSGTGMPDYFSTPVGSATTELHHVVFTHDANTGQAFIYVDGVETASGQFTGNFNQWGVNRVLALANEAGLVGSGRSWLGELHLIAIYSAALAPAEVEQNFRQGTRPARVIDGLQALYTFQEKSGTVINDVSGVGLPLNLNISEPDKVTWLPGGGLAVNSETRILSTGSATKVNEAARAADELTVEVWVKPDNIDQQGPARIVTISQGPNNPDRNFSLNQGRFGEAEGQRAKWSGRLSAGSNLSPGAGTLSSPNGTATTELQHVVFT